MGKEISPFSSFGVLSPALLFMAKPDKQRKRLGETPVAPYPVFPLEFKYRVVVAIYPGRYPMNNGCLLKNGHTEKDIIKEQTENLKLQLLKIGYFKNPVILAPEDILLDTVSLKEKLKNATILINLQLMPPETLGFLKKLLITLGFLPKRTGFRIVYPLGKKTTHLSKVLASYVKWALLKTHYVPFYEKPLLGVEKPSKRFEILFKSPIPSICVQMFPCDTYNEAMITTKYRRSQMAKSIIAGIGRFLYYVRKRKAFKIENGTLKIVP